jgi:transcriptional regulator with XRE-family HTH domain
MGRAARKRSQALRRKTSDIKKANRAKAKSTGKLQPAQSRAVSSEFDLGERLRGLRLKHGLSLESLAKTTGLTKGFLSLVERGHKAPSISTLLRLSQAFRLSMGGLLGEPKSSEPAYSLVRLGERRKYAREGSLYGYRYEAVAFRKEDKRMEPFIVSPPMRVPRKFFQHEGDEMVFVLSGRVEIQLRDDRMLLVPGDCLYFDAALPHRSHSIGNQRAITLVVISPR